jgi:hypothetical protein
LTLGDGGKMKLDIDSFPVGMVELMDKKVLVRTDQAETTKGKNMIVSLLGCSAVGTLSLASSASSSVFKLTR